MRGERRKGGVGKGEEEEDIREEEKEDNRMDQKDTVSFPDEKNGTKIPLQCCC